MKQKIIYVFLFITPLLFSQPNIIHKNNKYYFGDRIIVKYKNNSNITLNKITNKLTEKFGITVINNTFKTQEHTTAQAKELAKIFTLKYSRPYNPLYVIKKIKEVHDVEWAEPFYLYQPAIIPNDQKFLDSTQTNLLQISAEKAWDITTGNDTIIIAIVDTGIDWDHPDLENNIWINKNEIANNGIDDDHNGFVDDIRGWDFGGLNGTSDNNPNEDKADHGTHVAGIAGAVTNNSIGIASIGYNCKIMAVKTSQNNIRQKNGIALIVYGYQGIIYAADNGAKVINCSWGGYGYSSANQEAINYAVSKGALVVAAAGNDNKSDPFFPADYNGVLSVASVNSSDIHSSFSNYGTSVDVSAPGEQIYSTWYNNSYTQLTGTSMASPLVAGLAGLVTNEFPNFNPLQIAEQIRVNTDKINNINTDYNYLIGSGRINAYKTLANKNSKSVRILNYSFSDNNDNIFESGEELSIEINFINYLAQTNNLTVSILPQSNDITVINGNYIAGSLATLEEFNNSTNKFKIKINNNASYGVTENILVKYTDGAYSDYEWITLDINPTYKTQKGRNINLTITSKGSLGFNDFPDNLKGDGLIFKNGKNLLFEGALMYGISEQKIINSARNSNSSSSDNDFNIILPFELNIPGFLADEQGLTIFDDNNAGNNSLKIKTTLQSFSYNDFSNGNFIILKYDFYNNSNSKIDNFYAGIYTDFDIGEYSNNDFAAYDFNNNFGYVYDNEKNPSNPVIAIALLNSERYGFFAMDIDGTNDSVSSYNGFSDLEKWKTLSNGLKYVNSGPSDISTVTSAGPFTLMPESKIEVAFAIAGGDSLNACIEAVNQSKIKYNSVITHITNSSNKQIISYNLQQNFPNPFNPVTTIKYTIANVKTLHTSYQQETTQQVELKVYDILGREVATLVNKNQKPGNYQVTFNAQNLASGMYLYKLKTNNRIISKKMLLLK